MSCRGCNKSAVAQRPDPEALAKYKTPCDCGVHDWVYVPANKAEVCRKCRQLKRPLKDGKNPPCVGKPPWTDLA